MESLVFLWQNKECFCYRHRRRLGFVKDNRNRHACFFWRHGFVASWAQLWASWPELHKGQNVCLIMPGTGWGFQRIHPLCMEPSSPAVQFVFRNSLLLAAVFKSCLFNDGSASKGSNRVQWWDGASDHTATLLAVWDCTILDVGISFMSAAYLLWVLVCGCWRGAEAGVDHSEDLSGSFSLGEGTLPSSQLLRLHLWNKSYGTDRFCML